MKFAGIMRNRPRDRVVIPYRKFAFPARSLICLSGALLVSGLTGLKEKGVNLRVINNSWGGPYPSLMLKEAFCAASEAGILLVCAAALLLSKQPSLSVAELKALLLENVDQLPAWQGKVVSGGRLNVAKATQALATAGLPRRFGLPIDAPARSAVSPPPSSAPALTIVSRNTGGRLGADASGLPAISNDGRFVAFVSASTNFAGVQSAAHRQIFLHDCQSGATVRISENANGLEGNDDSDAPSISGNGRFVVFQSVASNLVVGDTNNAWDVFIHDRTAAQTKCLSLTPGGQTGNGDSTFPTVTPDGRFVAFESYASDLVSNDLNQDRDVFLYDTVNQSIELASRTPEGHSGNGASSSASISDDGQYVLFASDAEDLAPAPARRNSNAYLYDRSTRTVTRAGAIGNEHAFGGVFSADGRYLAFQSFAPNLLAETAPEASQVLVWDRARFQPDASVRSDVTAPYRGGGVFAPATQSVEQTVSPARSRAFFVSIMNAAEFTDRLIVTGTAGDAAAWQVQYFDVATGGDITAAVVAAGWDTGDLVPGVSKELRVAVSEFNAQQAPKNIAVKATSTADNAKSDSVLFAAQPDHDGDGLPDEWERAYFGSIDVANSLTDHDGDSVSDLAEYRAGTDPTNPASVLRLVAVTWAGGHVELRWTSAPNRFYTVERSADLAGGFQPRADNLAATPPENAFLDSLEATSTARYYRIRVELP